MNKLKIYTYYILIAGISIISLTVIPLLQSSINASFQFPRTAAAWILWIGSRLCVTILNLLIFHCFICQADLNTQENESRKQAEELLALVKQQKEGPPLSKREFLEGEYRHKVPTLTLSTICSLVAFGPAVLMFDVTTFLTYLFTVIMAVVFGVIEMFKVETYYTVEYLRYAKYVKETEECLNSYYSQLPSSSAWTGETKYLGKKGDKNVKI